MALRIATFNANNLFSRWSFAAELPRTVADTAGATLHAEGAAVPGDVASADQPVAKPSVVNVTLDGGATITGELRMFQGRLVRGKDPKDSAWIAKRIKALD